MFVTGDRIELSLDAPKTSVLPLNDPAISRFYDSDLVAAAIIVLCIFKQSPNVGVKGFEPPIPEGDGATIR
jgi:hypothetical protein